MIKKLNVLLLLYFYVFKLQYLSQAPKLFFSCTHIKLESGYITCKKEKKTAELYAYWKSRDTLI